MKTVNATDAKQKFGELIDMAQRGPVTVTKQGRKVAVMISAEAYELDQKRKLKLLEGRIAQGVEDIAEGRISTLDGSREAVALAAPKT